VYFSDHGNSRVRKIAASTGIITTVAGGGWNYGGGGGDGGLATDAVLWDPWGLAFDASGNLYIAQRDRIRKVNAATGIITTIAGSSDYGGFGGDGGPATAALLYWPTDLAINGSGDIYVADSHNHRIRKISAATGTITTVAGGGGGDDGDLATAAGLYFPEGLALGRDGSLYISDSLADRVRRVDPATGIISTVAGTAYSQASAATVDWRLTHRSTIRVTCPWTVSVTSTLATRTTTASGRSQWARLSRAAASK